MWKKWMLLIGIVCCLLSGQAMGEENVRLTTLEWLPYAGSDLPNNGFSCEIITKAFEADNIRVDIEFQPWLATMQSVADGKFDALFSAYYTDDRAKQYVFSDPYAESILNFYKLKKTNITYKNLEDLKGSKIGIVKGFSNTPEFDDADYLTKTAFDTEMESLESLLTGKVDLIIMDQYVCIDLLNRHFTDQKQNVEAASDPLEKRPLYLLFSKKLKHPEALAEKFNAGLKKIRDNGLYDLIMLRHKFIPEKMIFIATLEWPPYAGENIKNFGFISEIVTAAYEKVGYKVNISIRPWARVLTETEDGRHDIAFPAYYTKERDRKYTLVNLNVKSRVGLLKSKNMAINHYESLQDLAPYRIGVVHGYANRPDFDAADYLRKKRGYSDLENMEDLIAGNLDFIVIDPLVAGYLMRKHLYDMSQWDFLEPMLDEKDMFLAFSKSVPDTDKKRLAFEYGLAELKKEGLLDALIDRYRFKK